MMRYLHEYIDYEKRQGMREKTLMDHTKRLAVFFDFLERFYPDITGITDVTREILTRYEKYLVAMKDSRGKVMSRDRRYRYVSTLKVFFAFLQKHDHIFANPAAVIVLPKLKRRVVRDVLSPEEMERLVTKCPGSTMKELRDRAILELLYSSGIRADELCNIEIDDIDLDEHVLYVRKGKLDKERVIPFGRSARYWIEGYLIRSRPLFPDTGCTCLFTSMTGTKLRPPVLCKIIKYRAQKAGIEKNVTTHTFRHSCATHMLKGRADIRYVQQQLGHRSIQTTEKYLKIEITDLKEVHERCHPREQDDWEEGI